MVPFLFVLVLIVLFGGAVAAKTTIAVALGVMLGFIAIGAFVKWRVRRALDRWLRPQQQWRRVPGSRVEVLERDAARRH